MRQIPHVVSSNRNLMSIILAVDEIKDKLLADGQTAASLAYCWLTDRVLDSTTDLSTGQLIQLLLCFCCFYSAVDSTAGAVDSTAELLISLQLLFTVLLNY